MIDGKSVRDHTDALAHGHRRSSCFHEVPQPDDALLIGLSDAVPSLRRAPPVRLPTSRASASTRRTRRSSGRPGPATAGRRASSTATRPAASTAPATSSLHVPRGHAASLIDEAARRLAAGRVVRADEGQPAYSASPSDHAA